MSFNNNFDPDKKILPGNEIKGCKTDTGKHPIADIKSQSVSGKNRRYRSIAVLG